LQAAWREVDSDGGIYPVHERAVRPDPAVRPGRYLIYVGFFTVKGGWGIAIGVVGFVPIIMALWGRCLAEFIRIPIPF